MIIAFKALFGTMKTMCATDGFQARYPPLLEGFGKLRGLPDSRWYTCHAASSVAYHDRDGARPKSQRRPMDCLVPCLVAEKEAAPMKEGRWTMTSPTTMNVVGKVAASTKHSCDVRRHRALADGIGFEPFRMQLGRACTKRMSVSFDMFSVHC